MGFCVGIGAVSSTSPGGRAEAPYEHPLVVPQLGHTKHVPERIMTLPHS